MSTCWKCGKELPPGQNECEEDCGESHDGIPRTAAEQEECDRWFTQNFMAIDLSRVRSLAQLKAILKATNNDFLFVQKGTPEHRQFAKYLKPLD